MEVMVPATFEDLNHSENGLGKNELNALVDDIEAFLKSTWTKVDFSELDAIPKATPKKPFELMRPYEGLICHVVDDSEDEDEDK